MRQQTSTRDSIIDGAATCVRSQLQLLLSLVFFSLFSSVFSCITSEDAVFSASSLPLFSVFSYYFSSSSISYFFLSFLAAVFSLLWDGHCCDQHLLLPRRALVAVAYLMTYWLAY